MAEDQNQENSDNPDAAAEDAAAAEAANEEVEAALKAEAEIAKKKSLKLFIIMAVANVFFIGWLIYSMRVQVEEPRTDEVESLRQEIPEETPTSQDEEVLEALTDAVAIEPFLVNVVARHKGKARQGQKVLRLRFEVVPETDETKKSIKKHMPKIRDRVNLLLSSQDYGDLAMSHGREALRRLIQDEINEVIEPERIQKVYFVEFVIN